MTLFRAFLDSSGLLLALFPAWNNGGHGRI